MPSETSDVNMHGAIADWIHLTQLCIHHCWYTAH